MVEAPDDWGENVALTQSQHLIDGSLSLDDFRSGWVAAMAALGQTRKSLGHSTGSLRQLVEQRLRLLQIKRVEPFSEPAVNRS
jgi:hypothetical protein